MALKKRILICMHALGIGGAERALLDMLYCLDYERVQVDLFLLRHEGEWMDQIPEQVNLLPEISQYTCLAVPMTNLLKKGQIGVLLGRLRGKRKAQKFDRQHALTNSAVGLEYSHKYTLKAMPQIQPGVTYDLAISFLTPHYFVSERVKAKRKLAWIHTDYSAIQVDADSEVQMWGKYDYIASISDECTKRFLSVFPSLQSKMILIENVLSEELIKKNASKDVSDEMPPIVGELRLLSIGRFSREKNFSQIPEICSLLIKNGCNVKWYIIGYGDASEINNNRKRLCVEDRVIILGKKDNPYPYIRNCDVYVQPSLYEGKAVTVREAQVLNKPVIITDYTTADSQLERGIDGIIVPLETEACASAISETLQNTELLNRVAGVTVQRDYTNVVGLETLYKIME